ncbi:13075_t:CDS:2 [Rhizophagus irregularis]|nr:13075_t:CDS:2 [Rhizophagus irregularis]
MAETTAMACPLGRLKMHDLYQLTPHTLLSDMGIIRGIWTLCCLLDFTD